MNLHIGGPLGVAEIADLLMEARSRTLLLIASVSEEDLRARHDRLVSPVVWDLGHIAHFEDVWLLESLEGGSDGLRGMYNPFENPRGSRAELPLPNVPECLDCMAGIRRAVLDRVAAIDLAGSDPLLRDGLVFRMVLQHEYQHNETILQTLQLKGGEPYRPPRLLRHPEPPVSDGVDDRAMVRFPGGPVEIGTGDRSAAYDNERPLHTVDLAPFWIDQTPVTNAAYARFVEEGGYETPEFWSDEGRRWREESGVEAPKHWGRAGAGWEVRTMDRVRPLDPRSPVCHVCFHEAEAYARSADRRLPTEFEWEAAATWDPVAGVKRAFPWGEEPATPAVANVDVLAFGTAPVGSYVRNVSPIGCYGMIGDVWEWTSSDFLGYPGYRTFPYPEYSEVFFGHGYKVLRGGAWATRGGAIRGTFRNWDYPIRRQIFSGLRCARDD